MKPNPSTPDGDPLRDTLRTWKVAAPLPPRFREQVWQRIARAEPQKTTLWALLVNWLESRLARPALAVAYVAVLVLAGSATGYWQSHESAARAATDARIDYVRSVDPFQMSR